MLDASQWLVVWQSHIGLEFSFSTHWKCPLVQATPNLGNKQFHLATLDYDIKYQYRSFLTFNNLCHITWVCQSWTLPCEL